MTIIAGIKQVDLTTIDAAIFKQQYTGCIVLTHDKRLLLQRRPDAWRTFPGMITTFGGRIEANENPTDAIMRELHEELGAKVKVNELVALAVVSEAITEHTELVHLYFWHDKSNTITGCYEGQPCYFATSAEALAEARLMDEVKWALITCKDKQHIS